MNNGIRTMGHRPPATTSGLLGRPAPVKMPEQLFNSGEFSPRQIQNLAIWLDANDSSTLWDATSGGANVSPGGAVARWVDKAQGVEFLQGTLNSRPLRIVGARNGRDVVRCDGFNDGVQSANVTLPTFVTVFIAQISTRTGTGLKFWIEQSSNANTNNGFFFIGTNASSWTVRRTTVHAGPSSNNADWIGNDWSIATFRYDGSGTRFRNGQSQENSTQSGSPLSNSNVSANLFVGNPRSSFPLTGDFGEILIYSRALAQDEMLAVHRYLADKWGIA